MRLVDLLGYFYQAMTEDHFNRVVIASPDEWRSAVTSVKLFWFHTVWDIGKVDMAMMPAADGPGFVNAIISVVSAAVSFLKKMMLRHR